MIKQTVEIEFENEKLNPDKFHKMLKEEIKKQKEILCKVYENVKFAYFKTKDYHTYNYFGEIEKVESYIILYFFRDETIDEIKKRIKYEEEKKQIKEEEKKRDKLVKFLNFWKKESKDFNDNFVLNEYYLKPKDNTLYFMLNNVEKETKTSELNSKEIGFLLEKLDIAMENYLNKIEKADTKDFKAKFDVLF